jgi:serine O-acetyltransferase
MQSRLAVKCGFLLPIGVFGKGLSVAHKGTIIVNHNARIGENCRIHEGVTIGSTNGPDDSPKIGNNVFIATGAKIIGDIYIADDVAIGANAVVVKSINEPGTTWGGVPARKISENNSHSNLNKMLGLD